jgi:hypothetical protein
MKRRSWLWFALALVLVFPAIACQPSGPAQPGQAAQEAMPQVPTPEPVNPAALPQAPGAVVIGVPDVVPPAPGGKVEAMELPVPATLEPFPELKGDAYEKLKATLSNLVEKKKMAKTFPALVTIADQVFTGDEKVVAILAAGTGRLGLVALEEKRPFKKLFVLDNNEPSLQLFRQGLAAGKFEAAANVELLMTTAVDVRVAEDTVDVGVVIGPREFLAGPGKDDKLEIAEAPLKQLITFFKAIKNGGIFHVYGGKKPAIARGGEYAEMLKIPFETAGFILKETKMEKLAGVETIHYIFEKPGAVKGE